MTLSELWQLWRDNLMSWRSFCDEHHDLFTLNIQAGFRRIGRWLSDLRSNARALAAANRDRRFPESEYGAAQLFLFFRSSLERRAAAIREGFSNRRKALTWMGGKRRHFLRRCICTRWHSCAAPWPSPPRPPFCPCTPWALR